MEPWYILKRTWARSAKVTVAADSDTLDFFVYKEVSLEALLELATRSAQHKLDGAYVRVGLNGTRTIRLPRTSRPRWYLLAVGNFDEKSYGGINANVELKLRHDSCDDRVIVIVTIVAYGLLVLWAIKVRRKSLQLILWSTWLGLAASIAELKSRSAGQFLWFSLDGVLLCSFLMLARGLHVYRRKLPSFRDRCVVALATLTYSYAALIAWVWHHIFHSDDNFIDGPDYVLLTLRCIFGGSMILSALVSKRKLLRDEKKKKFYSSFLMIAVAWTLALPLKFAIASIVRDFDRRRASRAVEAAGILVVHGSILRLLSSPGAHSPFDSTTSAAVPTTRQRIAHHRDDDRFRSVTGGRAPDVNADGKYVITDTFEANHVMTLIRLQRAIDKRVDDLRLFATDLNDALDPIVFPNSSCHDSKSRRRDVSYDAESTFSGNASFRRRSNSLPLPRHRRLRTRTLPSSSFVQRSSSRVSLSSSSIGGGERSSSTDGSWPQPLIDCEPSRRISATPLPSVHQHVGS